MTLEGRQKLYPGVWRELCRPLDVGIGLANNWNTKEESYHKRRISVACLEEYNRLLYRIPSSGQWRPPQWEDHHPYFYRFHPQKKVKAVSVEKFLQKPDWQDDKRLLAFKQLTIDDFLSDFENHWWDKNWAIVEYRILEYQMEYFMVSLAVSYLRTSS